MARRPRRGTSLSCSADLPAADKPGGIDPRALFLLIALVLTILVLWRR